MTAVGDKAVAGSGGKFTVEALAAQLVEKKFAAWYLDSQFADVYPHQCQCVRHGASKGTAMRFIKLTDWCGRVEAIPDSANKIDARLSVNDELYKIARLDLDQFSSTFSALFSRSAVCVATPNHSSPPLRCIGCRRLRAADRRGERVAGGALPAARHLRLSRRWIRQAGPIRGPNLPPQLCRLAGQRRIAHGRQRWARSCPLFAACDGRTVDGD